MWIQYIAAFITSMLLAAPIVKYNLMQTRATQLMLEDSSSKPNSLNATAESPQTLKVMPSKKFSNMLETLEERKIENKEYSIYGYLVALFTELLKLDSKLKADGVDNQDELVYAKYAPILERITELTAPNYYGSFIKDPTHWNDPKKMRTQVEVSVFAVISEVAEDMRRINSSQELDFEINVESIIGNMNSEIESDPERTLKNILEDTGSSLGNIQGNLEEMKSTAEAEIKTIMKRQNDDKEKEAARVTNLQLASTVRKGSKDTLEFEAELNKKRTLLFSKVVYKKSYKIHGPGEGSKLFIVECYDQITEQRNWKRFNDAYTASAWIDDQMMKDEKLHPYNCECLYCK